MIQEDVTINDRASFIRELEKRKLPYKKMWDNYKFLPKTDYYHLVLFTNGEYGLFTQCQMPVVIEHQDYNSGDWRKYKPYADRNYPVMRDNGVEAGTKIDENVWTSERKKRFRQTDKWRIFVRRCLPGDTVMCEDCHEFFSKNSMDVHHVYPEQYDVLIRKNFKVLCKNCHAIRTARGE